MLETSVERVKLLKAGISGKKIEELYIEYNYFKISKCPVICEQVEIIDCEVKRCDGTPNRSRAAGHDGAVAL
jgi:hypothetical protein